MPVSAEIIILPKEREVNSGFAYPCVFPHMRVLWFLRKSGIIIMERQYCAERRAYINGFLGNNRYFG